MKKINDEAIETKYSHGRITLIFTIIIGTVIGMIVLFTQMGINHMLSYSKEMADMVVDWIDETVESPLKSVMHMTQTMAEGEELKGWLSEEKERFGDPDYNTEIIEFLLERMYLSNVKYAYLASFQTNTFYDTSEGIRSTPIDFDNPEYQWLLDFMDSEEERHMDYQFVMEDERRDLIIDTSYRVKDENGKTIAVTGMEMRMMDIYSSIMNRTSDLIDMEICIIQKDGTIEFTTIHDEDRIPDNIFEDGILKGINPDVLELSKDVKLDLSHGEYVRIRYLQSADRFIVVYAKDHGYHDSEKRIILMMVSIAVTVILILMFVVLQILGKYQKEIESYMSMQQTMLETDALTALYNRHGLKALVKVLRTEGMPEDLVLIAIDINGLKEVNDNLGHEAGDNLIIGAADCIRDTFEPYGKCFRVGGDEYEVIINLDVDKIEGVIQNLIEMTDRWEGKYGEKLSLSIGYAAKAEEPEATLDDLIKISDKRMYEDKKRYYQISGKDRRKR